METNDRSVVLNSVLLHGLSPTEDEIEAMVAAMPALRDGVERLYGLPGAREAEPAVLFDPLGCQ